MPQKPTLFASNDVTKTTLESVQFITNYAFICSIAGVKVGGHGPPTLKVEGGGGGGGGGGGAVSPLPPPFSYATDCIIHACRISKVLLSILRLRLRQCRQTVFKVESKVVLELAFP